MALETSFDELAQSQRRLRDSRAEVVALILEMRSRAPHANDAFPRSALMRAAMGRNGRVFLSGAALSLALLKPGLLPMAVRLTRWAPLLPLLRGVINRYVVRRNP